MNKSNDAEGWGKLEVQSLGKDKRIKELQTAAAKSNDIICQTLGKVLGFPWYKDDLDLFPGATEADGVCIGDHVAETMAVQAADRIRHLDSRLQIDTLNPNRRGHISILVEASKNLEAKIEIFVAHMAEAKALADGHCENTLKEIVENCLNELRKLEDEVTK
jgi:hypothetical protein